MNRLSAANRRDRPLTFAEGVDDYPVFSEENNVSLLPAAPEEMTDIPDLSPETLVTLTGVWTPRYLGVRYHDHGRGGRVAMDTRFATPEDSVTLPYPAPGSALVGTATGTVALDDLLGRIRPDPESRGALEPA